MVFKPNDLGDICASLALLALTLSDHLLTLIWSHNDDSTLFFIDSIEVIGVTMARVVTFIIGVHLM